ncbi:hypothetical protein N657DRAFT_678539 [Parathielavia appendiculata]|uniref:Uncharacterized protein n=1 Tax=Parathielavia appendiculata TaxID=2587402 RepID=A0AAN6U3Q5_9PEZI|nr:hypothetical protein N657DRAFT_678539 [Parathielavia appendiculata]
MKPEQLPSGHRPLPPSSDTAHYAPVMNLYANYSGALGLSAMKSHKLCGPTESNFLYLVECHFGYTPRDPLNFGRGYYLRNGTSLKDQSSRLLAKISDPTSRLAV